MKTEELSNVYLRAMFYGDSGSGKTHLLGTAMQCPETSPMLVLNARGQPISFRFLGNDLPLILTVESMSDFNSVYAWIMDSQPLPKPLRDIGDAEGVNLVSPSDAWMSKAAGLPSPWNDIYRYLAGRQSTVFKSFAVDSITQVQRIANDIVMDEPSSAYTPESIPAKRGYNDYQKLLDMLTRFADHHYKLPIHVFMTALCRHSEMPTLGITKYYPFLWGQAALEVPSYAELVGRLINIESLATQQINAMSSQFKPAFKDEQPFNVLYTRGGRDYIAKWQGPMNPPDLIINPTIRKLLDVLNGSSAGLAPKGS